MEATYVAYDMILSFETDQPKKDGGILLPRSAWQHKTNRYSCFAIVPTRDIRDLYEILHKQYVGKTISSVVRDSQFFPEDAVISKVLVHKINEVSDKYKLGFIEVEAREQI